MKLSRFLPLVCLGVFAGPVSAQQARKDAFGDPLPAGAIARLGTVRLRHQSAVRDAHFIAGGKWLLSEGFDGTLRVWDPQTGRQVQHFPGVVGRLSVDGKTLLTWCDRLRLWDLATGKEITWSAERVGKNAIQCGPTAFTNDGLAIVAVGSSYGTGIPAEEEGKYRIQTFDRTTGKLRSQWLGPQRNNEIQLHLGSVGDVIGISFGRGWDPDNYLQLYDAATGKALARCPYFNGVEYSADGSCLMVEAPQPEGAKDRLYLLVCDARTGKERYRYPTNEEMVVALSPDGKLVAFVRRNQRAGDNPVLRIAEVASGKILHALACSPRDRPTLRFSANGAWLALAQEDDTIHVWDVATGKQAHKIACRFETVRRVAEVSPDGKFLAAVDGSSPCIQVWSLATGKRLADLYTMESGAAALAFSGDSKKLASMTRDGAASVWDATNGKEIDRLPPVPLEEGYFPFEGPRLAWADNGHVHLLGLARADWPGRKDDAKKPGRAIHRVDLNTGKPLRSFGQVGTRIFWWTASADGRTVAAATAGKIMLWDGEAGQSHGSFLLYDSDHKPSRVEDDEAHPTALAFAPNAKTLAVHSHFYVNGPVGRFGPVTTFELASGQVRGDPWPHDRWAGLVDWVSRDSGWPHVVFTPDGKLVAVATGYGVLLWDPVQGREVRRFGEQDMVAASVAFSPDGKLLAAIHNRGGLLLWDVATGTPLRQLRNGPSDATAFAFGPDSKTLATAWSDTTVLLWDLKEVLANAAAEPLSAKVLEGLWNDLASSDASAAAKAVTRLQSGGPPVAAFLRERVQPVPAPDPKLLQGLLADLESDKFSTREKAGQELERMGDLALPALRQLLRANPSLETQRRVEKLVERMEGPTSDVQLLRLIRAIEVLEEIGGAEARDALEALARGMPGHRVTEAAQDALKRVK